MTPAKTCMTFSMPVARFGRIVGDRSFDEYAADEVLRLAVERLLTIFGEAMTRLRDDAPDVFEQIDHAHEIRAFRNILVHSYDGLRHELVFGVIEDDLDPLLHQVLRLLEG